MKKILLLFLWLLSPALEWATAWLTVSPNPSLLALCPCVVTPTTSCYSPRTLSVLRSTTAYGDDDATSETRLPELTEEELQQIQALYSSGSTGSSSSNMDVVVREALPTLSPRLMVKLRQLEPHSNPKVSEVSKAINSILNQQLQQGADLLRQLLTAGEIRKLDSLIGKAGRENRLDPAFFQVLSYNLQDASNEESPNTNNEQDDGGTAVTPASRYQILEHIYTRCQEEVEKTIPPGVALLNKLLRTTQPSIRSNLISHYLTTASSQPAVIKSPDGKEITLQGTATTTTTRSSVLVPIKDFIQAIANFVEQIRTVEATGGTDRVSAAAMVETCRQLAKEVRIVIAEHYGADSRELSELQDGLMPVFRPSSPSSPYIQGQV